MPQQKDGYIYPATLRQHFKLNYMRYERYETNRPRPRYGHKYTKSKMCFRIMMVIYIQQHLSNWLSSIPQKVKQHWTWVEKKAFL